MSLAPPDRIVVVTVSLAGADGAAELSRQWVDAFVPLARSGDVELQVWSLNDRARPEGLAESVGFRSAQGSRVTFASFALRPGERTDRALFVVTHLQLLPVLLPVLYRGARVAVLLLGVEAWKPLRRLTARALRQSWRVLAISRHTLDRFRASNPLLADVAVKVCAPGLPGPSRRETRESSVSGVDRPYALIVGRMAADERYKGHDELIAAWPRVRDAVPDARLVIAGTGSDEARLRGLAAAHGLSECIVFTGQVSADRLAALYRDARFFVMPSRNEGFGFVYLEAMRAGKPCIVSRGAAQEIVDADVHGFVVDGTAEDVLAGAMVRLFTDDALCARMGEAAALRVAERFTHAHFNERVYEALELRTVPVAC